MNITNKTVLITGANRGIGRALVEEALRKGAETGHAVLSGPVDTETCQALEIPKGSTQPVARAICDGVEKGEEDIFPDPMSESISEAGRNGVSKALERQFAGFVQQSAANVA